MCWKHGLVLMVWVPLGSFVMPAVWSFIYQYAELPAIPIVLVPAIYLGMVAAPSMITIGIILYRRRIFREPVPQSGYISKPAKATVFVLAIWIAFPVWIAVVAPNLD